MKKIIITLITTLVGCVASTSASQQEIVAGPGSVVTKLSALGGTSVGAGTFQVLNGILSGNWSPVDDGDLLGISLPVRSGDTFEQVVASVYGSAAYTVTMLVTAQDDAFHAAAPLGHAATSAPSNSTQTLAVVPIADDNTEGGELVSPTQRSYHLQFRAHRLGPGDDGGALFVGPIVLVTTHQAP
jgi:hypothetical protein